MTDDTSKSHTLSENTLALQIITEGIEKNMTNLQLQNILIEKCGYKWSIEGIRKRRAVLQKGFGNSPNNDTPVLTMPPPGLADSEKASWFKRQFKKTHLYNTLKKQFDPDEVEVYLEDFGLLCCQFDDIVVSEFMQVDDFLKQRILVDRQLVVSNALQKQISGLQTWLAENPRQEGEDTETTRHRILQQRFLDDKYKYLKAVQDRYDSLVKERQKIYKSLAATRQDRLEELRGGKETFLELVAALQCSKAERDKQGIFAELTRLSEKETSNALRQPIIFPDGTKEPMLLDPETAFDGDDNA